MQRQDLARKLRQLEDLSHGTFLLAAAHASPFFDGTGQRWEVQEKVEMEPKRINKFQKWLESRIIMNPQKTQTCVLLYRVLVLQRGMRIEFGITQVSGPHVATLCCQDATARQGSGTWRSWIDMNCSQHVERFQTQLPKVKSGNCCKCNWFEMFELTWNDIKLWVKLWVKLCRI